MIVVLVRPAEDPEPGVIGPIVSDEQLLEVAWRELVRSVGGDESKLPAGFRRSWAITNLIGEGYRVAELLEVPS